MNAKEEARAELDQLDAHEHQRGVGVVVADGELRQAAAVRHVAETEQKTQSEETQAQTRATKETQNSREQAASAARRLLTSEARGATPPPGSQRGLRSRSLVLI